MTNILLVVNGPCMPPNFIQSPPLIIHMYHTCNSGTLTWQREKWGMAVPLNRQVRTSGATGYPNTTQLKKTVEPLATVTFAVTRSITKISVLKGS